MNLIEKLKDKTYVRAFGLMLPEEQECFRKVGKENCLFYYDDEWDVTLSDAFSPYYTYAIKPDYQPEPEPEYVDLEIKEHTGTDKITWLGVYDNECPFELPHFFTHLRCLPGLPKFEGFYLTTGDKQTEIRPEWVARHCPNVVARFKT